LPTTRGAQHARQYSQAADGRRGDRGGVTSFRQRDHRLERECRDIRDTEDGAGCRAKGRGDRSVVLSDGTRLGVRLASHRCNRAWKGIDAYAPHACNVDNFNIPPTWLWVGFLGVDGSDSSWLSVAVIAATMIVMVLLVQGRSWYHGVIALGAIISPSVMMGVERGNLDLLVLALVGSAALIYEERRVGRACGAIAFLGLGVALKLFPMFCVSLAARYSRKAFIFACATAALSSIYLGLAAEYVLLIRRNVPTTFILSYGYKAIFLGVDHIRSEAGLSPIGLADTWMPASTAAVVLICAATVAVNSFRNQCEFCSVQISAAGTAFLFGAGIYCGTYLLGTNFIYRLMFLLLCVPQLQDWQIRKRESDKSGHTTFLLLPQLLDWFLFFCMAAALMLNFLRTSAGPAFAHRGQGR
jgi:hypothetical protein